jgi:hypothetical protein
MHAACSVLGRGAQPSFGELLVWCVAMQEDGSPGGCHCMICGAGGLIALRCIVTEPRGSSAKGIYNIAAESFEAEPETHGCAQPQGVAPSSSQPEQLLETGLQPVCSAAYTVLTGGSRVP